MGQFVRYDDGGLFVGAAECLNFIEILINDGGSIPYGCRKQGQREKERQLVNLSI